jgi:hypothetical protein
MVQGKEMTVIVLLKFGPNLARNACSFFLKVFLFGVSDTVTLTHNKT